MQRLLQQKGEVTARASFQKRKADFIAKYGDIRPPIIKQQLGGTFIAVGSRLLSNHRWKTFHDFLFAYLGSVFEKSWPVIERAKPLDEQHPILHWYCALESLQDDSMPLDGIITRVGSPPAQASALLSFAYDVYILEHHAILSKRMVMRLQMKDQFQGARYEVFVAAACLRAGFTVELEDESDRTSTHCEFTITHKKTGIKFSVEAKSRARTGFLGQAGQQKPLTSIKADISGLLVPALRKTAEFDRLVFIDINVPPSESALFESEWFKALGAQFNRLYKNPQGDPLPPAYIFLTNYPYHYIKGRASLHGQAVLLTGLNLPEFEVNQDRLNAPTTLGPTFELHQSLLQHTAVPYELDSG